MDIRYSNWKKLNFFKQSYILSILLITTCFFQFITIYKNNQLKKFEEEKLINRRNKIEDCLDIENKNKRTIYENIKLSEYCIDKLGVIKWF